MSDEDEFLLGDLQFRLFKINIIDGLKGNQVDVCVRDFETYHRNSYPLARDDILNRKRHFFCKQEQLHVIVVFDVEDIILLLLGDYEGMADRQRIDVEKSQELFMFCHFIARDLSFYDFCENA